MADNLKFLRILATGSLFWEQLWVRVLPVLGVAALFVLVGWAGLWPLMPLPVQVIVLVLFALAILGSLAGFRRLRAPSTVQTDRRIERASRLAHQPVTVQNETLSLGQGDRFAEALWREHRQRMAGQLHDLQVGMPRPQSNRVDPFALRAMLALALFVGFAYSFSPGGGRIGDALDFSAAANIGKAARLDAWVDPPAYTRRPPIVLTKGDHAETLTVPQGSILFVRFADAAKVGLTLHPDQSTGGDTPQITITDTPSNNTGDDEADRISLTLKQSGAVKLTVGGEIRNSWQFKVIEDTPPTIAFVKPPRGSLAGTLQLAYQVADDYGVKSANARIGSTEIADPHARPLVADLEIPLPLPRKRARKGSSRASRDLSQHPYAGSNVAITLSASDDAGQIATSPAIEITLPGRHFVKPLARAVIEQRRKLALDATKAQAVANMIDALTFAPEDFFEDSGAYLGLRTSYRTIIDANSDDDLRDALDLMWEIALAIEFGDLSEVERRLREAQEALSEALERGASDQEIARRMDDLRQAMNQLMKKLAEDARRNAQSGAPQRNSQFDQMLRQQDLENMLDRIEDLARSGSPDAARELLSEMQRMMDNLRAGTHARQRRAEGDETNQAMDKLGEIMQRQRKLLDETFSLGRQDPNRSGMENGERSPGEKIDPEAYADAMDQLREQQDALRDQLRRLSEKLGELGLEPPQELGEAGEEMVGASENLGRGEAGQAIGNQGRAIDSMQQGARSMMQQMTGERGQGGEQLGNQGQGGALARRGTDPLGRNPDRLGNSLDGDSTEIPSEIDAARAREILDAIRRRLANPLRPRIEQDYLERLLRGSR